MREAVNDGARKDRLQKWATRGGIAGILIGGPIAFVANYSEYAETTDRYRANPNEDVSTEYLFAEAKLHGIMICVGLGSSVVGAALGYAANSIYDSCTSRRQRAVRWWNG